MDNIAIIGVGALGERHLQSFIGGNFHYKIYAVESNEERAELLKQKYYDTVNVLTQIADLPRDILVCIIATTSDVRRRVFSELVDHADVKNILFEKVLFQRKTDYFYVREELKARNIRAWVNCGRREWDSYKQIKSDLETEESFTLTVTGGEWGLCCNGIHLIDLAAFLSGDGVCELDSFLPGDGAIVKSKRDGFYEINGTLIGRCGKCKAFQISCLRNVSAPSLILIASTSKNIIIDEANQIAYFSTIDENWKWYSKAFEVPYVSQQTAKVAEKIINGTCDLPSFEEAMKEHLVFLDEIHRAFISNGWEDKEICPIT